MSKEIILNALDGIHDRYITEAAGRLGLLNGSASALNRRRESALSRFFSSGWGVAMICAVVSLSVLGGIVWAGQRPVAGPQGTATESETAVETEAETEPEIVEGELDKSSDLVSTLVAYLEQYWYQYALIGRTFSQQIDDIKSGIQPLLVAFDPSDYYFVCGYHNPPPEQGDIHYLDYHYCNEYTWVLYKDESNIQEYYNGMKWEVVFQINKALIVTDIVSDERAVPFIHHFQIFTPAFENGLNVREPVVFDETFIYLNYPNAYLNKFSQSTRTMYYCKSIYYHPIYTIPCVYLDGEYYLSFHMYTIYSDGKRGGEINFSYHFGQYYDALIDVTEKEKYSITDEYGRTIFYGAIRIDDFVDGVIK